METISTIISTKIEVNICKEKYTHKISTKNAENLKPQL